MAILAGELKLYKSSVINDTTTNGGRLSSDQVVDAVKNNIFPDVSNTERIAGIVRKRKIFYKIANDDDLAGTNGRLCLDQITPGDSSVVLFKSAANDTDTQGDLTGSERLYGVGELNANVSAAATVLVVNAEAGRGADFIFQANDTIYISDGSFSEFATIAGGGVSWSGDQATITITAGLTNGYSAATPTVVSACIDQATIDTSTDNWVETSGAGIFDEITYPVINDSIGTVRETWTFTFSDATNYTVSGDTVGSVGSGTTGGDFAPNNADFTKPYFTLTAAGFSGTWANGDTIVFQTHPSTVDFWIEQDIPAGAASIASDSTSLFLSVESA